MGAKSDHLGWFGKLKLFDRAELSDEFLVIAAITVILCVPPLVLFFFVQRFIMDNALGSSVKG